MSIAAFSDLDTACKALSLPDLEGALAQDLPVFVADLNQVCNCEVAPLRYVPVFVSTVKLLIEKPQVSYKDTPLYRYYKSFAPKNMAELYGLAANECKMLAGLSTQDMFEPWVHCKLTGLKIEGIFGPKPDDFIKREFIRFRDVLRSIQRHGYDPVKFKDRRDGLIMVQAYRAGDRYQLRVIAGNHRAIVLKALGRRYVPVTFMQNRFLKPINLKSNGIYNPKQSYPKLIDLADCRQWPAVKSGCISKTEAKKMFLTYINNDSTSLD